MHKNDIIYSAEMSRVSKPKINHLFHIALTALLLAVTALTSCKVEKMPEYIKETHYSKTSPLCTYAVYRDISGCDETTCLYFFHGSGGNENTWFQANRKIIDTWRKQRFKSPLVVAVTFGTDWLMFPKEVSEKGIHLETFVHDLMPEIERQLGGKITRRLLYGFSIGGANVAQLFFRYPELFEKAAIISPQVYLFSIYASDMEIDTLAQTVNVRSMGPIDWLKNWTKRNILKRNSVSIGIHKELSQMKWNIPDPGLWAKADILKNMKQAPTGRRTRVYISCGRQDEIGFFPGAETLAKIAAAHGYDVRFDPLEGGHMTRDYLNIASFLKE